MKNSRVLLTALAMGLSVQQAVVLQPGTHGIWKTPHGLAIDYRTQTYPKGKARRVGVAAQKRAAKKRRNIRAKSSKR